MTLVWLAGVSLCEAIAAVTPLKPRLKWPNDLLLPDSTGRLHKIAGILLESGSSSERLDWAVIGCGLNVSASPPPDPSLRYPATSLQATLGHPVPRLPLLRAILERMDDWYTRLQAGGRDDLYATWHGLLATLGQPVHIALNEGTLSGTAEDVDTSGALHVRDEEGTLHIVTNGDVSG
jgi:BirA family biotin operon repressor/biotin-[acetyl-CoA-carboxylase] ligase